MFTIAFVYCIIMPGIRQQIELWHHNGSAAASFRESGNQTVEGQSALVTRMMLQYTSGQMSAIACQKLAHAAVVDGCQHREVWQVAAIGMWGEHPGNCNRDLKKIIGCDDILPEPLTIRVPCLDTKSTPNIVMWDDASLMVPHTWLASVADLPEAEALLGLSKTEEFWTNVSPADPRLLANGGHPVLNEPNYKSTFVALWVHGDGVEYSEDDSMLVYTCGSTLTTTNSMLAMFYLASFVKSVTAVTKKHGHDTWAVIWRVLAWSFQAAWLGIHPSLDWDGNPFPVGCRFADMAGKMLCRGYRFLVWNLIGDLEYFANALGLSHWRSHSLCWCCNAHRKLPDRSWLVNWPGRGWLMHDPVVFHMASRHGHKLLELTGVTSWSACFDSLHVLDTKGLCAHLIGSVLHDRIYNNANGASPQHELARIWRRIQELYLTVGRPGTCRLTHLQLSMLGNVDRPFSDFPTLHAKGAETRHLVPVLAAFIEEENFGGEVCRHQLVALQGMTRFYQLCDSQPMFLSSDASNACVGFMEASLASYSWLHLEASSRDRYLYNIVPKVHYAWHLAWDCRFLNARHKWTYKCESWVGTISGIGSSCSTGNRITKITVPLAEKFRLYVFVRLTRQVFED